MTTTARPSALGGTLAAAASKRTVGSALASTVGRRPDAAALVADGRVLTYRELDAASDLVASALLTHGAHPDEPVVVLSQNSLEYVLLMFGAAKAGVPLAHLNWRQDARDLAACLTMLAPRLTFVSVGLDHVLAQVLDGVDVPVPVIVRTAGSAASGPPTPCPGMPSGNITLGWDQFVDPENRLGVAMTDDTAVPRRDIDPESCLHIVFTSGSTGGPKAAMISHRAMLARAATIAADVGVRADEGFIAWSPMYHIAGSDYTYITAILGGTTWVLPGFDAVAIADIVATAKLGWLMAIPGTIQALILACRERAARPGWNPQVRAVGVMPDLIPANEIAELTDLVRAPFLNSYGTTEGGLMPGTFANLAAGVAPTDLSKPQSALCDVRIVDDSDAPVSDGTAGEMLFRSPTLFSGYVGRSEDDAKVFAGGWFHTGDIVVRRPNGNLDFVERKSYMIKSGGENIYPAEIERVIASHELIVEVAVVRAPSARWGQTPVAFVSTRDRRLTAEDLRMWCRDRMAPYKIPTAFEFVDEREYPRNVSGKIDRRQLERRVTAADTAGKETGR